MPEIGLQRPRVGALVRERITARVSELMRMHREIETRSIAEPPHHLAVAANGKRRAALRRENERRFCLLALEVDAAISIRDRSVDARWKNRLDPRHVKLGTAKSTEAHRRPTSSVGRSP